MGDMSNKRAGQRSSDSCHSSKKARTIFLPHMAGNFPAEIWNVELPEVEAISQALKPL